MLAEIRIYFETDETVGYIDPANDITDELRKVAERQGFNVNEIESYKETGEMYEADEILI